MDKTELVLTIAKDLVIGMRCIGTGVNPNGWEAMGDDFKKIVVKVGEAYNAISER